MQSNKEIWVAIIGAVQAIAVALLAYFGAQNGAAPRPSPPPQAVMESSESFEEKEDFSENKIYTFKYSNLIVEASEVSDSGTGGARIRLWKVGSDEPLYLNPSGGQLWNPESRASALFVTGADFLGVFKKGIKKPIARLRISNGRIVNNQRFVTVSIFSDCGPQESTQGEEAKPT
jgi:hypothetical protein